MSPILGIWASGQQPALNASSFYSIATVTVGAGGSSSITFSSIPSTYKHLQIRCLTKFSTVSNSDAYGIIQFNSDTNYLNYSTHGLYGDGASVGAYAVVQNSTVPGSYVMDTLFSGAGQTNMFATQVIDILEYTNTNKYKTVRSLSGWDANGSGWLQLTSGLWSSTSSVSSITLVDKSSARNFAQYSSFALYGIK